MEPISHSRALIFISILGKLNLKPVLVDGKHLDDLSTKEVERVFGYPADYTRLETSDLRKILGNCTDYEHLTMEDLVTMVKGHVPSKAKIENFMLSRTARLQRLGQGFAIQAFEPLLKPLKNIFE